jgi:hypothetical protein
MINNQICEFSFICCPFNAAVNNLEYTQMFVAREIKSFIGKYTPEIKSAVKIEWFISDILHISKMWHSSEIWERL